MKAYDCLNPRSLRQYYLDQVPGVPPSGGLSQLEVSTPRGRLMIPQKLLWIRLASLTPDLAPRQCRHAPSERLNAAPSLREDRH